MAVQLLSCGMSDIARSMLVQFLSNFFSIRLVSAVLSYQIGQTAI